jgi:hypothetical protein
MHVRLAVPILVLALAGSAGAAVANACGGPAPDNLQAPATLRATLRAVFLAAHPRLSAADVAGPLPGRTYYGSYGDFHAVATFEVTGHLARPTVFWSGDGRTWKFHKDTHGGVGIWDVSPDLMKLWGFTQWRHSPYWVEPRR